LPIERIESMEGIEIICFKSRIDESCAIKKGQSCSFGVD
jgi:hypothetical protein